MGRSATFEDRLRLVLAADEEKAAPPPSAAAAAAPRSRTAIRWLMTPRRDPDTNLIVDIALEPVGVVVLPIEGGPQ
jgi:hypothetical protein